MATQLCIIVLIILLVCVLYWTGMVNIQESFITPTVQTKTLTGGFTSPNNMAQFNLRGGNQVWEVSASGWSTSAQNKCTLRCTVDSGIRVSESAFTSTFWFNPPSQHMTYPVIQFTTQLAAGAHSVTITLNGNGCTSDGNDIANIMVTEY